MSHVSPEFKKSAFNCPHCGAYAQQTWYRLERDSNIYSDFLSGVDSSTCSHCRKFTIWVDKLMIYPEVGGVPSPHIDLPEQLKKDYEEARSIVSKSPRGAAALLRLLIQQLTDELLKNKKAKDLNNNIKLLVQKGLRKEIQEALDSLRVVGNNAVHPGQMDIADKDRTISNSLFDFLNMIVEEMISRPKKIEKFYSSLPEGAKKSIEKRDNTKKSP